MKNAKIIASILMLMSCTKVQDSLGTAEKDLVKAQTEVSKAADAIRSCQYLDMYANEIEDSLKQNNYRAAFSIASAAYLRTLETSNADCLIQVKELIRLTQQMVMSTVQDGGVSQ